MEDDIYLGVAGVVGHNKEDVYKYNKLLDKIGADEMLVMFERFIDGQELKDMISHIEDSLSENKVEFNY